MSTEKIAHFITETSFEQLPIEAIDITKRAVLDCVGVTIAGIEEPGSRIVIEYVKEIGGTSEAGVIGTGYKAPAPQAAWVNGTMAHVLDYDDVGGFGHPSVAILPAVLAIGEKCHISGKDVLLSYIVGFEVGSRLGQLSRRAYAVGWHSTCTIGTIAAAAAAAKALKLNNENTQMALGIATSLAGGLKQNFGTMTKSLHAGNAARNGVIAATLAQKGFTADKNIIENPQQGFLRVLNTGADVELERVTEGLGEYYNIVPGPESAEGRMAGIGFKAFASCLMTHTNIEAALHLRNAYDIRAEKISKVECMTHELAPVTCLHSCPKNGLEGKFSIQYCVARALLDGEVGMKHFSDEAVRQSEIQELMKKVKFGPPTQTFASEVVIELQDGKKYTQQVNRPKGTSENPMTWEEMSYKYKDCASFILPVEAVQKSQELITSLESLEDISTLMDIVTCKQDITSKVY